MPRVRFKALFGGQWIMEVMERPSVEALKDMVSRKVGRDERTLWIVYRGRKLEDPQERLKLKDGDFLLVVASDKKRLQQIEEEDVDEVERELRFKLRGDAPPVQRFFRWMLQDVLKLPEHILAILFGVKGKTWGFFVLWCICSHFAGRLGVGPIYILTSIIAMIFLNLGKRQEGELSAYSVFNEGFRELPGTLNADRIDHQIRQGHM